MIYMYKNKPDSKYKAAKVLQTQNRFDKIKWNPQKYSVNHLIILLIVHKFCTILQVNYKTSIMYDHTKNNLTLSHVICIP